MDILILNIINWIWILTFQFWNFLFTYKTFFDLKLIIELWIIIFES
jgi:hypothetical protein